jgi:hypothetical protein
MEELWSSKYNGWQLLWNGDGDDGPLSDTDKVFGERRSGFLYRNSEGRQ